MAYCMFCKQDLKVHKTDLLKHKKTKKHAKIEEARAKQHALPYAPPRPVQITQEQTRKRLELRLALVIAIKASFR